MSLSASSFRDPTCCIEIDKGKLFRTIKPSYRPVYDQLITSGLYKQLVNDHLLIPHIEYFDKIYPEIVKTITYPYEWSFYQLKTAALKTLEILKLALANGLILKDASAFNIQYHKGHWLLIDTGSFDIYEEGQPWNAYGQFLRHFICPLVSFSYGDKNALKSLLMRLDGMPVEDASLPIRSWFNANNLLHIHSHKTKLSGSGGTMSKTRLYALIDNLYNYVKSIKYKPHGAWVDYEPDLEYTMRKHRVVDDWLPRIHGGFLLDIGTNNGDYANIADLRSYEVIGIDREHDCVNLPHDWLTLNVDITNPTPAIGWANKERQSFLERVKPDTVMVLAVLHHICIGNNVPLKMVAETMAQITGKDLIMEWVDGSDPNSQKIGKGRIYPRYDFSEYLDAFAAYFNFYGKEELTECRSLCHWRKR